ncbi:hypothetical protein ACTHGU_17080 [Chitinophagaceae bacterium MMS25-I14]
MQSSDHQIEFLAPRLTGRRFDDHSIPLELLEDFAAFEELLVEVAKWLYLKQHPDRHRVPKGFTNGISLKLSSIDQGSSIAKIVLVTASTGLFANDYSYFEQARDSILSSIDAAETNKNITEFIPEYLLGYFNRIGKRLKDDEAIDFSPNTDVQAKLTNSNRKKLVLASSKIQEVTLETSVRALIPEIDKEKKTFIIQLKEGRRLPAAIKEQYYQTILDAFAKYEQNNAVLISGIGKFNKYDKLESFDSIEHITHLDPLDVRSRLEDIATLENGWLNGEGIEPNKVGLNWFSETFENNYDPELPLPYLYPTINGDLQAEWTIADYDITLSVNLGTKEAHFHSLKHSNDEEDSLTFDLNNQDHWNDLNQKLLKIKGV